MRILFWCEQFWPEISGVSLFGMSLMDGLKARGHEFAVVTSQGRRSKKARETVNGVPVYRFPFHPALLSRDLKRIAGIIREIRILKQRFNPDVIHINSSEPSLFFQEKTQSSPEIPCRVTVHMSLSCQYGTNTLFQRVLHKAGHVTAISRSIMEDVRHFVPEAAPRVTLLLNALPEPEVAAEPLNPVRPRLLCLGRLSEEKGFDVALRAVPKVLEKHKGARLIITGEGPEEMNLKALASRLRISGAVEFTGPVPLTEVQQAINRAFLVLVPSRWREPFGLVALQAAQMGRPVIASNTGGLREIVIPGKTGWLFEKGNSAALAQRINQLLDSPRTAMEMGDRAREWSREKFDFHQWIRDYERVFLNLSERRQP